MSSGTSRTNQGGLESLSRESVGVDMIHFVAEETKMLLKFWSEETYGAALHGCELGGIGALELFLFRLVHTSNPSTVVFMSILVYLRRLRQSKAAIPPTVKTAYNIVLASLIIAFKVIEDPRRLAKNWSKASQLWISNVSLGFDERELAGLEIQLGEALGWKLHISEDDLYREVKPYLLAREAFIGGSFGRPDTRVGRGLPLMTRPMQILLWVWRKRGEGQGVR